jgi:U4/U6 small nuclear ribonucleoprotein PRP3
MPDATKRPADDAPKQVCSRFGIVKPQHPAEARPRAPRPPHAHARGRRALPPALTSGLPARLCFAPQARKRSRWGAKAEATEAPAAAAPAAVVEDKAAQLAAKQAKIQEQMAQMAALLGGAGGAGAGGGGAGMGAAGAAAVQGMPSFAGAAAAGVSQLNSMAAPGAKALTMDAEGNLLDDKGQVVQSGTQRAAVTSLKVNMNAETKKQFKVDSSSTLNAQVRANPYFDPRMKAAVQVTRKSRSLNFHGIDRKAGTFAKAAEKGRARVAEQEFLDEMKKSGRLDPKAAASAASADDDAGADANTIMLGARAQKVRPKLDLVPDIEWWDAPFIASYDDVTEGKFVIRGDKITHLEEHPVLIEPPTEKGEAAPTVPLYLTKQERKKLRTKNRVERQRDLQEQIRMGLMPAPDNKLKISNFMKSLVSDAVADPTQIEADVRKQMKERMMAHEKRNNEKKLAPEERKAKRMEKVEKDKAEGTHVAVFKVGDLSSKKNRYKVDINAAELHLTGCVVHTGHLSLVVVEGGTKALKKYKKLMLQRIDWKMKYEKIAREGEEMEEVSEQNTQEHTPHMWLSTGGL